MAVVNNILSLDDRLIEPLSDFEDLSIDDDKNKPSFFNKDYDPVTFQMLKVKPSDFADQITLIDIDVFKSITCEELLSGNWSKKNKRTLAPNVMRFTDRFNLVCLWCQKEILAYDKPSKRAGVIAHFIKISKHLAMLKNMHSTFAIISALQSHSIHRLKKTWECLGRRDRNTFHRLAALFDSDRNWEKLRQYLENPSLPCIPYLGMFLTDLNFIEAKNLDNCGSPNVMAKNSGFEDILRKIRWFQHSSYSHIPRIECIQKYLASMQHHEELIKFVEEDIYKQSLLCEPDEKSFPLESNCGRSLCQHKAATLSRTHLRQKEENDGIKLKNAFQTLTPRLQGAYLKEVGAGHRRTRSFDAQAVLGLRDEIPSLQQVTGDSDFRNVTSSKDVAPTSVFYVDAANNQTATIEQFSPCITDDICDSKPGSSSQGGLMDSLVYGQPNVTRLCNDAVGKSNFSTTCIQKGMDGKPPVTWQGEVRKIVVRTRGSKPAKLKCSRKCYLELSGHSLIQYEHRALVINCKRIRDHYKKKMSKRMLVGGENWKVIGPQCEDDASFELHHPSTGRIYRYLCYSHNAAAVWHSKLLEASDLRGRATNKDLISFE